jgi:hypothetical protein
VNHLNHTMCAACDGECCKRMPGHCLPSDFGETGSDIENNLATALQSGKYAIDWWEGDPRANIPTEKRLSQAYFIRPATVENRGLFDPSWGGLCVFHTPEGCLLPDETRPYGCRMLKPDKESDKGCIQLGTNKQEACVLWIPYHAVIEQIGNAIQEGCKT